MKSHSIQKISEIFHENTTDNKFVEQTKQQIIKDASGLCDVPKFEIDFDKPLIGQFVSWINSIQQSIRDSGNTVDQFYYIVDLPEKEVRKIQLDSSNELNELILYREAQKVYLRNIFSSTTQIDEA